MCLIVFSYKESAEWPLVLVANRDEFHARPTLPLALWDDQPEVLGGRDLQAGGGWLAVTTEGRLAAVTNYRDPQFHDPSKKSRGDLLREFLVGGEPPEQFARRLPSVASGYNLMNLLFGSTDRLFCYGSRSGIVRELAPGLYGLSNAELDDPWPKVQRAKAGLGQLMRSGRVESESLLALMLDRAQAPDEELPGTGLPLPLERLVSSIFIASEKYGTRATTALVVGTGGKLIMSERSFGPNGAEGTTRSETLALGHQNDA